MRKTATVKRAHGAIRCSTIRIFCGFGLASATPLLVGDDLRWDIEGALRSGIETVLLSDVPMRAGPTPRDSAWA
jgi:hypothetical protein